MATNETAISIAYDDLQRALQKLDDLGENLQPRMALATEPNLISGRTHIIARYDGEWKLKKAERAKENKSD